MSKLESLLQLACFLGVGQVQNVCSGPRFRSDSVIVVDHPRPERARAEKGEPLLSTLMLEGPVELFVGIQQLTHRLFGPTVLPSG